jgi:hypothetical protein
MRRPARSALVLQGGGALGAFEFGAARALYEQNLAPDVIGFGELPRAELGDVLAVVQQGIAR